MHQNKKSNPRNQYSIPIEWAELIITPCILALAFLCILFLAACSRPPEATDINLKLNPNPNAPLAGILSFETNRPVRVSLHIDDGEHQQEVTPDGEFSTKHQVMVLGLRPGRKHWVSAVLRDKRGSQSSIDSLEIETPPLPEDFPPFNVIHKEADDMERGITLINLFRWESPFDDDSEWGLVVGVDHDGDVVWYLQSDFGIGEARRMHNGNLIISGHKDGRVYEVDMLGNFLQVWHSSGVVIGDLAEGSLPVDTDGFHHDVIETPAGNFIGLGLEVVSYDDFPAEYPPGTKRAPAQVANDVIIEFDRKGKTLRKWSVGDILDPERLGEGSLSRGFYEDLYREKYDTIPYDITHSNAIYYVEDDDAVIVSAFRSCIIYKVDMATGELLWILGDSIGWKEPWAEKLLKPIGDITWPCHQHGVELSRSTRVLLFDNGGGRYIPPQEPLPPEEQYSRAVEYRIDEDEGTVEEVWVYGPEQERFASPFISDADHLPWTRNVLITDGGRFKGPDGENMNTFGGHQWGRVLEVTHDDNPNKVWELEVYDPEVRYSLYRAQRFRSLYPKLDRPTG